MTGNGTSESPFKIETAEDFLSMGETGSPTAYYELANDINMDGDGNRRLQDNPKITLNCASLDGKGHKIRNIMVIRPSYDFTVFSSVEGVTNIKVKNMTFENFNLTGKVPLFFGGVCKYNLENCVITVKRRHKQLYKSLSDKF